MTAKDSKKKKRSALVVLIIAAVIAIAVAVFKSDDCWPDPEPEPVPCKGSHCPVEGEATTGEVIKDAGSTETAESTGDTEATS